jgi:hypothetical protein
VKIPAKFQVFEDRVVLPGNDRERLAPHLSGWNKLNGLFLKGVSDPDLKRLVVLELMGRRREEIIRRLLMRLGRVQRRAIEEKIKKAL